MVNNKAGATVFHRLIDEAKGSSKYGAAVTLYPVEDYEHVRLFVTPDGDVGFALKGDDIVSLFKHSDSEHANIVDAVLPLAVQEGGRKLDCFDTVLPVLYGNNHFTAVSRTAFDEQYQPPGWDKELFGKFNGGKPDVVFMKYDPAAKPYKAGDGKMYPSYDEAAAAVVTGGEYSPGLKAVDDHAAISATKTSWIESSPHATVDDLIASAPAAQSQLGSVGRQIATTLGVEFKDPGVKTKSQRGIDRVATKMADRGGKASAVTDVVRGAFIVTDPKQSDAIAAELAKHFEVTLENWRTTNLGYMDRAALVKFDNGMIGEIQFMSPEMSNAKSDKGGNGHGLYVEWRALDPTNPIEKTRADELIAQMRALYGAVSEAYSPEWKAAAGKSGS